jgi:hypothetical protein
VIVSGLGLAADRVVLRGRTAVSGVEVTVGVEECTRARGEGDGDVVGADVCR